MRFGSRDAFYRLAFELGGGDEEHVNPCLVASDKPVVLDLSPRGGSADALFRGTGDFLACYERVKRMLRLDSACYMPPCAIDGVHAPFIPPDQKFLAYSGYFYTANALGLVSWDGHYSGSLDALKENGIRWCAGDLSASHINEIDPSGASYRSDHLLFYCFNAAYVYATLVDAYGFSKDGGQIVFSRTFGDDHHPASWTLGAVVHFEGAVDCTVVSDQSFTLYAKNLGVGSIFCHYIGVCCHRIFAARNLRLARSGARDSGEASLRSKRSDYPLERLDSSEQHSRVARRRLSSNVAEIDEETASLLRKV